MRDDPEIVIVVAVARNGVIGRENGMPWRLPSDLRHFRATTMGRPVVMGRKTFESIGRPLDGRTNIVVTRDPGYAPEGVVVAGSLAEALDRARAVARRDGVGQVMVTGGGQIYAEALPLADRVVLTEVDLAPDGTVTFPPLDPTVWRETAREAGSRGPKDEAGFSFVTYERSSAAS
ncbi:dihydrofolate reductase [Prosthecomicrobium sp. N25]|uniref:dihydrofolate reductase n=1 Tax=Prosthecomicrobium sp. N25 TaxID=3129254 RepID=UPI003077F61B